MRGYGALAFNDVSSCLLSEISRYASMENDSRKPYLVMNNATAIALNNRYKFINKLPENFDILNDDGFIGKFDGCNVYTDNTIEFGAVNLY